MATAVDLSPVIIDLKFTREDGFPFSFTLSQGTPPVIIDLTGSTFLLTVDLQPFPPDAVNNLFQLSENNTPGPTGVVQFLPTQANMDQTPTVYFYDVQWTDAAGNVRTAIAGQFEIVGQITQ